MKLVKHGESVRSQRIRRVTTHLLEIAGVVGLMVTTSCSSERPERTATVQSALSADLVIYQIYGGSNFAATDAQPASTYNQDFVVLFNRGASAVSLNGKTLQYTGYQANFNSVATDSSFAPVEPMPNVTVNAGSYFMIKFGTVGTNGANLPIAADYQATVIQNPAGSHGKFALVPSTNLLSGCGAAATQCSLANVIDFVGYGTDATQSETAPTGFTDGVTAAIRKGGGCVETDNNSTDFEIGAPSPKNASSTANPCATDGGPGDAASDAAKDAASDAPTEAATDAASDAPTEAATDAPTEAATGGTGGTTTDAATGGTAGATGGTAGATGGTGGTPAGGTGGATGGTGGGTTGGTGGKATGGTGGKTDGGKTDAGLGGKKSSSSGEDSGCGCTTPGSEHAPRGAALLALLGLAFVARRRRS